MISKVFDGHSFYHACRYMCNKAGAEVLEAEGVRGYNYKYMADDFLRQAADRPGKGQACFHAVLSFYPGEKPADELMAKIGRKYLEEIGIINTQYAITKHTDRAHLHVHIIANMVDNSGKSISDSWIGVRGKRAAQKLTKEYGLIPAEKKNLALTNLDALDHSERNRYQIYTAVMNCLPTCGSVDELVARLKEQGIETVFKYKGKTSERQGISFKLGDDCFKGSKVDRNFSLANLEKALKSQRVYPATTNIPAKAAHPDTSEQSVSDFGKPVYHGQNLLADLLKPEYTYNRVPYELLEEARKWKKKRRR